MRKSQSPGRGGKTRVTLAAFLPGLTLRPLSSLSSSQHSTRSNRMRTRSVRATCSLAIGPAARLPATRSHAPHIYLLDGPPLDPVPAGPPHPHPATAAPDETDCAAVAPGARRAPFPATPPRLQIPLGSHADNRKILPPPMPCHFRSLPPDDS